MPMPNGGLHFLYCYTTRLPRNVGFFKPLQFQAPLLRRKSLGPRSSVSAEKCKSVVSTFAASRHVTRAGARGKRKA